MLAGDEQCRERAAIGDIVAHHQLVQFVQSPWHHFKLFGLVAFLVCFYIVDKLTPGDLWKELVEKKNTAVAIFFGFLALGMSLIIAACLHG